MIFEYVYLKQEFTISKYIIEGYVQMIDIHPHLPHQHFPQCAISLLQAWGFAAGEC
jgi:hypothetical protein